MEINKLACESEANFAAQGTTKFSQPAYLVGVRQNQDISNTAGLAAFQTTLQSKLVNNDKNQRAVIIPITMAEFNGEAVAYESIGQHKTKAGKGTWDYIFTVNTQDGGSICDRAQLNTLEGKAWDWAIIDEKDIIKFIQSSTGIKGMPGHAFEVLPADVATPTTVEKVKIRVALKNVDDYNKNCKHASLGFSASVLRGVQKWTLTVTAVSGTHGAFDVAIAGTCPDCSAADNNMANLYEAVLTAACFRAYTAAGTDLPLSGISKQYSGLTVSAIRVQLDTTDAAYTNNGSAFIALEDISTVFGVIAEYVTADPVAITTTK